MRMRTAAHSWGALGQATGCQEPDLNSDSCSAADPSKPQPQPPLFFFLTSNRFYLFIYTCVESVAVRRLSLVAVSGDYSSLRCVGFSLQSTGSRRAGFSSCGTWASAVVARGL